MGKRYRYKRLEHFTECDDEETPEQELVFNMLEHALYDPAAPFLSPEGPVDIIHLLVGGAIEVFTERGSIIFTPRLVEDGPQLYGGDGPA
jgi:hypothetical protein